VWQQLPQERVPSGFIATFPKSMEAGLAFNTGITSSFPLKLMFQSVIMGIKLTYCSKPFCLYGRLRDRCTQLTLTVSQTTPTRSMLFQSYIFHTHPYSDAKTPFSVHLFSFEIIFDIPSASYHATYFSMKCVVVPLCTFGLDSNMPQVRHAHIHFDLVNSYCTVN
jgi:hypothetical protein